MATLMLMNVALFVPVVIGGCLATWFGWLLTSPEAPRDDGGQDGPPGWRSPVSPSGTAGPNDLARSA